MSAFTLVSEQHSTQTELKILFEFLLDFKNIEKILPAEKIADFMVLENACSFTIKGMATLSIQIAETKPFEYIVFTSNGLGKFNFSIKVFFIGEAVNKGQCRIDLFGDLNPFIKAMAEKPLSALINSMSFKLSRLEIPA